MPPKDHLQFIQLVGRLRSCAERHGDHALAAALNECALTVSGGCGCPMGKLILEDVLETGVLPGAQLAAVQGGQRREPVSKHTLPADVVKSRLYGLLEKKALRTRDTRFFKALEQCRQYVEHSHTCPLYRYFHRFHPDDPTPAGGKSPLMD